MYGRYFKRILDCFCALLAVALLAPLLLLLILVGARQMRGNPFFFQMRPGKDEKLFRLVKFRSMTDAVDSDGNPLPDQQRLTAYGRFLRASSLDELPELFNILIGQMSFVGPRPLLVEYLPYYTEEERHRHDVRPGLTGLAQINGRNSVEWERRFQYDLEYVRNITFRGDLKIIMETVKKVFLHEDVSEEVWARETNLAVERQKALDQSVQSPVKADACE